MSGTIHSSVKPIRYSVTVILLKRLVSDPWVEIMYWPHGQKLTPMLVSHKVSPTPINQYSCHLKQKTQLSRELGFRASMAVHITAVTHICGSEMPHPTSTFNGSTSQLHLCFPLSLPRFYPLRPGFTVSHTPANHNTHLFNLQATQCPKNIHLGTERVWVVTLKFQTPSGRWRHLVNKSLLVL